LWSAAGVLLLDAIGRIKKTFSPNQLSELIAGSTSCTIDAFHQTVRQTILSVALDKVREGEPRMSMFRLMPLTVVLLASAACGGSSTSATGTANSGGTTVTQLHGTMTASIDGSGWTAIAITTASYTNGILSIGGADGSSPIRSIGLALTTAGPGTFTIGSLPSAANAVLSIGIGPTWTANAGGGTGTIIVTALSSTAASGTFLFTAVAAAGGAIGTHVVTSGAFNITF
jgi:Family of unknown function (DUF6252)